MTTILAILMLATVPHDAVLLRDSVDLIELNHFYDGDGRKVFTQRIAWDWDNGRHQVVCWWMDKPEILHTANPPMLLMTDAGRVRIVRAKYERETHYQWDQELEERAVLPSALRRRLAK